MVSLVLSELPWPLIAFMLSGAVGSPVAHGEGGISDDETKSLVSLILHSPVNLSSRQTDVYTVFVSLLLLLHSPVALGSGKADVYTVLSTGGHLAQVLASSKPVMKCGSNSLNQVMGRLDLTEVGRSGYDHAQKIHDHSACSSMHQHGCFLACYPCLHDADDALA